MAGKVDDKDWEFFHHIVEPLIDGDQVIFKGEANARSKRDLFRSAACVLMPITWDEPFGLVLAEAMSCGTPVIVFGRGAAPEIVEHGETGFVVDNVDAMVDAVGAIHTIDPAYCRARMEERFDAAVMAARYLEIYHSILGVRDRARPVAVPSNGARDADLSPTAAA
jgi:glycosyltransferase involved in cell wall biosynthesis